jgi:hypothetical protein
MAAERHVQLGRTRPWHLQGGDVAHRAYCSRMLYEKGETLMHVKWKGDAFGKHPLL